MKGRFPANLLVSDDILDDGKEYKSHPAGIGGQYNGGIFGGGKAINENCYSDSGSFSRYFDLDAWWKEKQKEI